ncbi:MAG TPA: sensor histidine kinase, partial [Stenotrophomonas sp.]|nr:sensor histidine kinase [Stenotrophomonas sp.]
LMALCFFGEMLAASVWHWQERVSSLSVAPPLLLAWLLSRRTDGWLAPAAGAAAGIALFLALLQKASASEVALLALGLPLPALGLAWLLRRESALRWPAADFGRGLRLMVTIGLALPALQVAWLSAWASDAGNGYSRREELLGLLLMHCAGYLLLLPMAMAILSGPPLPRWHRLVRDLCVALMLALVPAWLWSPAAAIPLPSGLLTIAATPVLLWSLVRFGLGGACMGLLACAVMGLSFSLRGGGPFGRLPADAAMLSMQAWICAAAGALWLISVMLEQQRAASRRLRDAYHQLSALTGRVLVVQEEERTRIARELHDDINQSLAALSIRLSYLKRELDPVQRSAANDLQQDLLKVCNDIRNLSHGLHPAMLRFTGLASALLGFCQNHAQRSTLRIQCEVAPPEGLDDANELSLFRIVQEAVNNVERHAHAHEVWVLLRCDDQECVLSIADDGIGLPRRQAGAASGLGLISMGERARLLGGQLVVESRRGGGTHVEVRFPHPARADR